MALNDGQIDEMLSARIAQFELERASHEASLLGLGALLAATASGSAAEMLYLGQIDQAAAAIVELDAAAAALAGVARKANSAAKLRKAATDTIAAAAARRVAAAPA